jgi:A/G-specific adenine glycosylase
MQAEEFRKLLKQQGGQLYRDMPWRDDVRPYFVLVSELMLQQTQVARVIPKFRAFIERFPNERALAEASLADVLGYWQGLGYNRRAKYLHDSAKRIIDQHGGHFPDDRQNILRLPGVGANTAGAIEAYAFNRPSIFIETNVRTVYIHHFFADDFAVDDASIRARLEETLDREHPREFYWALMDYGSWLKSSGVRNVSRSRHYRKQSPLEGSVRQVRGRIVTVLGQAETLTVADLALAVGADERFGAALEGLKRDGLVQESAGFIELTK